MVSAPAALMYQIFALRQELEHRATALLQGGVVAFADLSMASPRFDPPELGFIRAITWFYGFYYEAGKVSLPFLLERGNPYGLSEGRSSNSHVNNVRQLRTYLHHNLNLGTERDSRLQAQCETWFYETCGSRIPGNDNEWCSCLVTLLKDAVGFLQTTINIIREIEKDEAQDMILDQWAIELRNFRHKHEFERVTAVVARDLGHEFLDVPTICNRYYDKWSKQLRLKVGQYDFEDEARRLIEYTLITDAELPLPVSGSDIMTRFGLPPGPDIRDLLKIAKSIYEANPCSREVLLDKLGKRIEP